MLKPFALTLGIATALLASSLLAHAAAMANAGASVINRAIKEDRTLPLLPLPNAPAKPDSTRN